MLGRASEAGDPGLESRETVHSGNPIAERRGFCQERSCQRFGLHILQSTSR